MIQNKNNTQLNNNHKNKEHLPKDNNTDKSKNQKKYQRFDNNKNISSKYFIGESLPHKWSTVYNYKPQNPKTTREKGEVYATFSLYAPKDFNASTAGNLLVDHFHETYFENKKKSIIESLSDSIKSVQERLKELLSHENKAIDKGVDLNISAQVIRENEVYFVNFGSNKILLLNDQNSDQLIDISKALKDPYGKDTIKVGSSYLISNQRYILLTEQAFQEIKSENIKNSLKSFNDLRFKNIDYEKEEKIAIFMIGYDIQTDYKSLKLKQKNKKLNLNNQDSDIENKKTMSQEPINPDTKPLPVKDSTSDKVTLPQDTFKQADTLPINPDQREKSKIFENEIQNHESKPQDKIKSIINIIKIKFKNFLNFFQIKINQYSKSKQFKKLQDLRKKASQKNVLTEEATLNSDPIYNNIHKSYTTKPRITPDMNTIQALFLNIKYRIFQIKDILLYDVIKINQRKNIDPRENPTALRFYLFVGILILILLVYSAVNSIRYNQEHANQILNAQDNFTLIKKEIDDLYSSPLRTSESSGEIAQRVKFLEEIEKVENKFTDDLNILPGDEVQNQKNKLIQIKNAIIKYKKPDLNILIDVSNIYEGQIKSFAITPDNIYLADDTRSAIYRQPIIGSNSEEIIKNLNSPQVITADKNNDLITYKKDNKVLSIINPANQNIIDIAGLSQTTLSNVIDIDVYEITNAIYTIHNSSGEIKVLNRIGTSYTLPSTRFSSTSITSIKDIKIIDGIIVLLIPDSGLNRVASKSTVEPLLITGFDNVLQDVANADAFAFDFDYIYVINNNNRRLHVFNKNKGIHETLDFVGQIDISEIPENEQIIDVDSDKNRDLVFITTNFKVYTFKRSLI